MSRYGRWMVALAVAVAGSVEAQPAEPAARPFATASRSPVVAVYGLPEAEAGWLLQPGAWELGMQAAVASHFAYGSDRDESVFLDGESYRVGFNLRRGYAGRWEWQVDIPYISHRGGELDGFIDDWHDLFQLPDNNRPQFPRNRLAFLYSDDSGSALALQEPVEGLGDIALALAYRLPAPSNRDLALRVGVELPTGEEDDLLGSGATDWHAGLYYSARDLTATGKLTVHGHLGLLHPGDGDVLSQRLEDWVAFGSVGMVWGWSQSFYLKAQLDGHSAFFDSDLREIGDASVQLVMGGSLVLAQRWTLDVAVVEDLAVETSPDVVLQLGLRRRWQ